MFSAKAREKLKFYVYLYIDPRDGRPFYIGKGTGNRCFAHLKDRSESEKVRVLDELRELGLKPIIEVLKYGLTEREALLVESTAIDLLDVRNLTNAMRGHGTRYGGRAGVEELAARLDARDVMVTEPAMLINISRAYRYGMTTQELYDVTRSAWRVRPGRREPRLALSVYQGVVREVFEIAGWVPGGSTMRVMDEDGHPPAMPGRMEFVGRVAEEDVRRKYFGQSVAHYFKRGAQNPVMYVNC